MKWQQRKNVVELLFIHYWEKKGQIDSSAFGGYFGERSDAAGTMRIKFYHIDDKAILQCIGRVYKSIPALLQKIHFDPHHPENHNIKITNKKLPYASVMGTNQIWKTMGRKDAIDKMVTNGYYMLDEKYETNKEKFDPRKQKHFEGFKDNFESEDKTTIKTIRGDVEMMVINGVDK